uniref:Macro domain-containing protein n=1 Tax=Arcella intermedia TaxID=1963864 RepID=A0A6B2L2L8_9EUKA
MAVLPRWTKLADIPSEEELEKCSELGGIRFPIRSDLNEKFILWEGDIRFIDVDALVNSTNESMNDRNGLSGAILEAAGPKLQNETSKIDHCKTGEAQITSGYNLVAKNLIHTVSPRYNEKFKVASENSLHNCYRSCLEILKERKMQSIAFPIINTQKKGFPPQDAAHVAMRTIRRFLEHWGKDISTVVFCVPTSTEFTLYFNTALLYFPRNLKELETSKEELPRDIGNEYGEYVIEERKIRISAFPAKTQPDTDAQSYFSQPTISGSTLPPMFSMMQESFDEERQKRLDNMPKEEKLKMEQKQLYLSYLSKAHSLDLSDIARLNVIYESGKDTLGRSIVVIHGNRLPYTRNELDRVFLYIIKILDKITNHPYGVVYIHSKMEERDIPEFSWMKKLYDTMDAKYGNHLVNFYVIHPTLWLKLFEKVVSSFMVNDTFWNKVRYIEQLENIYNFIDRDQLILPDEVIEHDIKLNGPRGNIITRQAFAIDEAGNDL